MSVHVGDSAGEREKSVASYLGWNFGQKYMLQGLSQNIGSVILHLCRNLYILKSSKFSKGQSESRFVSIYLCAYREQKLQIQPLKLNAYMISACSARHRRSMVENPLRIMISGAPASGKGTQCELIVQKVLPPHPIILKFLN